MTSSREEDEDRLEGIANLEGLIKIKGERKSNWLGDDTATNQTHTLEYCPLSLRAPGG